MKVLWPKTKKDRLPNGKVSVRWVHSRNTYQVYVGGRYLLGCSGGTEEEALEEMEFSYDCCSKDTANED